MAVCCICKKESLGGPQVRVLPCRFCGFDPNNPDSSTKTVVAKERAVAFEKRILSDAVATQIWAFVQLTETIDQDRVKRTLGIALLMHGCADIVCNLVAETPRQKRMTRVQQIDNELKLACGNYDMLGSSNYNLFSQDLDRLYKQCTQGWERIKTDWKGLPQIYREHYIDKVFEHEKGYPHIAQSALNYVRPDQLLLSSALTSILQREGKESFYTSKPTKTKPNGQRIKEEWPVARAHRDQVDLMWCQLLTLIGKEYGIRTDLNAILSKIRQDRREFISQMSNYLPIAEVIDFLDGRVVCSDGKVHAVAERIWYDVFGYP